MLLFSSVTNFPLLCTIDTKGKVHLMFWFYVWHSKGFLESIVTRIVKKKSEMQVIKRDSYGF